jgi:polar amino acid transport system substrate-binding protein
MGRIRLVTLATVALLLAACTSAGPSVAPTAGPATQAPSQAAVVTPGPTTDACAKANLKTLTAGKLTIGADNPAFPPYYIPEDPKPKDSPWELGYPPNGKGLESAVAYAVAHNLTFSDADVTWVPAPFNNVIQPGPKAFDYYLTQVSNLPGREKVVDLSDGYFDIHQAVVALASNPISKVTTVAGLKPFKLGTQVGTTSLKAITDQIQPTPEPRVFDTLDAAVQALSGGTIDGVVADLPTTFYMRDAQLTGGQIVGSLPTPAGQTPEHFAILLDKGSSLTPCVNAALARLKTAGTLKTIADKWITNGGAPELN